MVNVTDIITFPEFNLGNTSSELTSGTWIVGMVPDQSREIRYQIKFINHEQASK